MDRTAGAVTLPRIALGMLIVLGFVEAALLAIGPAIYSGLHTILDTAVAFLSGALALLLWDIGMQVRRPLPKWLAISFALTFLLELAHVLVTAEWFGALAPLAQARGFLRPATWPPAAYVPPIGVGCALWLFRRGKTGTLGFALVMVALSAVLFVVFQQLPNFVPPGFLGITRPALILVPPLWAAVGVLAWRLRAEDRLVVPVLWMAFCLTYANTFMLYARAPDDQIAMVAHLGKLAGYLALMLSLMRNASRDIRQRVIAEEGLRRSEARYRTLAENATDLITLQDVELRGLYVSPASYRLLGYLPEEVLASTSDDHLHPDDLDGFVAALAALSPEAPAVTRVHRLRRKDRSYIWVEASLRLVPATEDEPPRILTVVRDVSARKRAEDTTSQLQELLSDAIEAMQDCVALYDADDRLVLINSALRRREDCETEVFALGRTYKDIVSSYWTKTEIAADSEAFEIFVNGQLGKHWKGDGSTDETRTKDGLWFDNRHFRMRDGGILTISTDVSAARQAAIEIEAARDVADAANRAKSAFLASMSHEIRTPMTAVLGFADLLLDSQLTDSQRSQTMMLRDAARSLLVIINDILDISKIEAGKLEIEHVAMSPASIVDGVASILKAQTAEKGLDLRVDNDPNIPDWIVGDPSRVRQILLNLVGNALKFTETGHIVIRSRKGIGAESGLLHFEIEDSGIGVPADRQHLLFRDFSQIDASTSRRYGGTGLGLSICKSLAEAMGGGVGVSSEPGVGSTFWFTIGCQETAAPDGISALPLQSTDAVAAVRHILVAEDMQMNQIIIKAYLQRGGYQVSLAGNGIEAVNAVREGAFDLVLMDMEMPELDGLGATRAIRSLAENVRAIPIIALTANAMLGDLERCKAAGMNDFLSKPVDRDVLLGKISKWTGYIAPAAATVAAQPPAQAVLDVPTLDELQKMLGADRLAEMAGMFRGQVDEMIAVFRSEKDPVTLERASHGITSVAGGLGCLELMHLARRLSAAALGDNASELPQLIADTTDAARRAVAAVDARCLPLRDKPPVITLSNG
jgi:PAS domain S-box-containing protein